ncbi:MAG: ribonuclease PH [Phycisphaeraceae bacterium]|nr:ribonuclease PH [Phycisphaeraceae bacterium]
MAERLPGQMREVQILPASGFAPGAVEIQQGLTRVLCTASVSTQAPDWIRRDEYGRPEHGWVTAEYNMLPGSTPQRKRRGADSRATEIQRLIARVLRAGVDLRALGGVAITCDCDVLQADGGTRTAAVTGAMVALTQAVSFAHEQGMIRDHPLRALVAAVSVGIVDGVAHLDLDYGLDSRAEVDLNVAMDDRGGLIEVQGTAEGNTFTRGQLDGMLDLAAEGIAQLHEIQRQALATMGATVRPGRGV